MLATPHALWFTQMIEYEVPSMCQQALAQALVARSEALAARCEGLQGVSIQASDDGSRVLQYLQWQSRQAWAAAETACTQCHPGGAQWPAGGRGDCLAPPPGCGMVCWSPQGPGAVLLDEPAVHVRRVRRLDTTHAFAKPRRRHHTWPEPAAREHFAQVFLRPARLPVVRGNHPRGL